MPKPPAGRKPTNRSHDATYYPPSLADMGITKQQASDWRRLAVMPKKDFERASCGDHLALADCEPDPYRQPHGG